MGKKDKNKKKGKGAEKTAMKTDKKLAAKQKRLLEKLGEADINEMVKKLEAEETRLKSVIETVCAPDPPRSSFTFITHPEKEELILFGGELYNGQKVSVFNDLFIYNIGKMEWKKIHSPSGPAPRSGHQMVAVGTDGGEIWLFGGEYASPSQMQYYHFKDLWKMQLKKRTWEKINAPNGPSPRSGHRMIVSKKKLIVFGGFHDNNQSYTYYNDVHMFSLETYMWLKIDISGPIMPPPRSGCCMTTCPDGKILIWGGYSKSKIKKDVDHGVTHTDFFALIPDKLNSNAWKWSTIKPGGFKPPPRSSVGFTTAPNGKVYCFGGVMDVIEDEEELQGQFSDDLLSLDLNSITWNHLELKKKKKSIKNSGESVIENEMKTDETMLTVSSDGVFTMKIEPNSTSKTHLPILSKSKSAPSPRMNPGLCVCKGILYLFGGIYEENNKQHTFNDFYALDLHKMDDWKVLIPNNLNAHEWLDSDSESSDSSDKEDDSSESDTEDEDDSDSDSMMDTI